METAVTLWFIGDNDRWMINMQWQIQTYSLERRASNMVIWVWTFFAVDPHMELDYFLYSWSIFDLIIKLSVKVKLDLLNMHIQVINLWEKCVCKESTKNFVQTTKHMICYDLLLKQVILLIIFKIVHQNVITS